MSLFELCAKCQDEDFIGTNFVCDEAYKKEICVNCGTGLKKIKLIK